MTEPLRTHATARITVLATEGSAPRGAGTTMAVTVDDVEGTIGGGNLEYRAIEQARLLLAHPDGAWRVQDYPLGPLLGQCCGGRVRLLLEHVDPCALGWLGDAADDRVLVSTLVASGLTRRISKDVVPTCLAARGDRPQEGAVIAEVLGRYRRPLYLFGAGHVGQAIARHAADLPFRLSWFDTRHAFETIDGVAIVPEPLLEGCISEAPEDAAILILTHDHALDYSLTKASLERDRSAFVGLIGSATKKARFLGRLEREGVSAEARSRLTSPIGINGLPGKEPDVIAIATLAQLLQLARPSHR